MARRQSPVDIIRALGGTMTMLGLRLHAVSAACGGAGKGVGDSDPLSLTRRLDEAQREAQRLTALMDQLRQAIRA